jgi:hypothetical protein
VGVGVVVVLGALFALFRPDKAFVDDTVDEELDAGIEEALVEESTTTTTPTTGAGSDATTSTTTTEPSVLVLGRGDFVGQADHSVVGEAVVVEEAGNRQLVLPDLDSDNGPDLQLYLSPSADGSVEGGVKIGPLKGNQGTQSYELADGIDVEALPNVVIWCERFTVPFGTATLT